ncbi:MAG: HD domain-containing phosphohydrolase [Planctomycetota bacterium]
MKDSPDEPRLSEDFADKFSEAAKREHQQMRLLIADGNATIRKLLKLALVKQDYEVVEACDGEQALKIAMERPEPHAIMIDAQLSRISGLEVCRRLKGDLQYRTIPVVVMTSGGSNEEISDAVEAGADEFLSKPINRGELAVRLRSVTRMHRSNAEMIGADSVALSLARAVASKDGYSSGHVEQVANVAVEFGKSMGMDEAELKTLRYGAILHNVGKIAIPDSILEKTGPLTPRERALFHQHPRVGCDICSPLKPLRPVLPIIRHHKEHFDGTGYPDGLRGSEIPLKAQIVGIVDVYSALTNDRPFRRAKTHGEAIQILRERARRGLHDPDLIERFCDSVRGDDLPEAFVPIPESVEVDEVVTASGAALASELSVGSGGTPAINE